MNVTFADVLRRKPEPAASEVTKEAVKRTMNNSRLELLIVRKKPSSPLPSSTVFLETLGSSNNKIQDKKGSTISNQSFSPFTGRANTATVLVKSLLGIVDSSETKEMVSSIHQ